jgi:hypothetical protein
MSVAALSTAGFTQYIAASTNVSGSQKAFQSLQQALASGNLKAAQSAFTTYQQLNPSSTTASGSSSNFGSSSSATTSQFSTDMTALGKAISSGNVSTAQSAFATLQTNLKSNPSQAIANAEAVVAQTVQSVEDLFTVYGLAGSNSTSSTDPFSSILDTAYGLPSSSNSSDPATTILQNAYAPGGAASTSSAATNTAAKSGNSGNSASVNLYA